MKTLFLLLLFALSKAAPGAGNDNGTDDVPAGGPAAETASDKPGPRTAEEKWTERLNAGIAEKNIRELEAGGKKFIALWQQEQFGEEKGSILLLHDHSAHADWPGIIGPLRRELPRYGWNTLSLQLAGEPSSGPPDDVRLKTALAWLGGQGAEPFVLLGHGAGALLALQHAITATDIKGVILIGLGDEQATGLLEKNTSPVYDLYGSADSENIHILAAARQVAGRRLVREAQEELPRYRQFMQVGADHFFNGQERVLIQRIRGWLRTHVEEPDPTAPVHLQKETTP